MQFKALVLAHEDTSYSGKNGRVGQETLTVLDADPTCKLKDTVDCVYKPEAIAGAASLVGKTVVFLVDGVRPSNNMRPRFMVKGVLESK